MEDTESILIRRYVSDTGEHMQNEKNELEYIPFPVCNETGKPLELKYGVEDGMTAVPPRSLPLSATC